MTKEFEKAGIPTVQIAAVVDIAKSISVPRLLRGYAITCPIGNPNLTDKDERISRKKYIEKALDMLKEPARPGSAESI